MSDRDTSTRASKVAVEDVLLSWSGGKDSTMALYVLREDPSLRVAHLLTTVTKDYERVSIHGVRRELLVRQAEALGINLFEVALPAQCSHELYQATMIASLTSPPLASIDTHAFGDLFLADVRAYRERNLASLGKRAIFPVWSRDTRSLALEFIALGFRAIVVCVDGKVLAREFAGREFDEDFLETLPGEIDPCGENGEFHTFVYDGPIFDRPIDVTVGESVVRGEYVFQDLLSASSAVLTEGTL